METHPKVDQIRSTTSTTSSSFPFSSSLSCSLNDTHHIQKNHQPNIILGNKNSPPSLSSSLSLSPSPPTSTSILLSHNNNNNKQQQQQQQQHHNPPQQNQQYLPSQQNNQVRRSTPYYDRSSFDQNAFISISRQPYPTPYASPSKLQQTSYEPGIPSSNAAANNNNKKINILEESMSITTNNGGNNNNNNNNGNGNNNMGIGGGTTTTTLKRTNKTHVPSACINCKRAHLACDVARPCKRCVALGKVDTCIDIKHKKRGRPKLKDKKPHPYSTHPTADARSWTAASSSSTSSTSTSTSATSTAAYNTSAGSTSITATYNSSSSPTNYNNDYNYYNSNSANPTSNSNLQYYPSSTISAMYKDNNLYHPYHTQYHNRRQYSHNHSHNNNHNHHNHHHHHHHHQRFKPSQYSHPSSTYYNSNNNNNNHNNNSSSTLKNNYHQNSNSSPFTANKFEPRNIIQQHSQDHIASSNTIPNNNNNNNNNNSNAPTISIILTIDEVSCAKVSEDSLATLGYYPLELLNKSLFEHVLEQDKEKLQNLIKSLLDNANRYYQNFNNDDNRYYYNNNNDYHNPQGHHHHQFNNNYSQTTPKASEFVKSDNVFFSQAKDLHCPAYGDTIIEVADMIHLKQRNCQHDLYNVRMYLGGGLGADLLRKDTWNKFYVVAYFTRVKNGINHTTNSSGADVNNNNVNNNNVNSNASNVNGSDRLPPFTSSPNGMNMKFLLN